MDVTIFKSNDVNINLLSDNLGLFCNEYCRPSPKQCNKKCRDTWFLSPPKSATFRVNTLLTTVDEVATYINACLKEESVKQGLITPTVSRHRRLGECLVVSPWDYCGEELLRYENQVIVDAACGAAVLRGANVFAPGVMGMMSCTKEDDLVSVYADSNGKCKRGLCVPFTDPGKLFVGNGVVKMSRKHLFQQDSHPKGVAVEMTQTTSGVVNVNIPQHMGLLQNLPSIVCGQVLAPRPGDSVIDLCAAPGHKTTHLAALMDNKGILVALDKIHRKVEELKALCLAMKADCVKSYVYDSTKAVSTSPNPNSDWSPPFATDTFDRVLLDAPCSALGQRPQIGCKLSNKQIESYPKLQKKLFAVAVQLMRPGGSLVYSTCSLTTQENEDIVQWALDKFPQLDLLLAQPLIGRPGYTHSSLSELDCQKVQRFGPPLGHLPEHDTIGFFIAKFIKNS